MAGLDRSRGARPQADTRYVASFRNHGAFHEDCTVAVGRRLHDLLAPHLLRIGGYGYPRGRIPIDVFWQSGAPPADISLRD